MNRIVNLSILVFISLQISMKYDTHFSFEKKVQSKVLIKDIPAMTLGFCYLGDSTMITQDIRAQHNYIKLFDYKNDELIAEFGNTGRGPNELSSPKLNGLSDDGEQLLLVGCLKKNNVFKICAYPQKCLYR